MEFTRTITTSDEFKKVFGAFHGWVKPALMENIMRFIDAGSVAYCNANPVNMKWDGSLHIKFATPPGAKELCNDILSLARADSFNMTDDTLELWWD